MDIGAAITSLTTAQKIAKGLREIEKAYDAANLKAQIADLLSNIADAKSELVEAQSVIKEKDEEIKRLNEALVINPDLIEGPGGYKWQNRGEGLRIGLPVCPTCLDREARQVVLVRSGRYLAAQCPRCSTPFDPVERFLEPDGQGNQKTESQAQKEQREENRRKQSQALREAGAKFDGGSWMGR